MALLHYSPPVNPYLQIVYADDSLIVLNKPSGLLSVPGKAPEHKDCLQSRVQRVFPTATVVHRLDMATSGLMVMALNKPTHRHLSRQFELRQTKKRYQAIVLGQVEKSTGKVELPLICDWPNRPKQMVCHQRGKPSTTLWEKIEGDQHSSRLLLTPITGRSHQLRVHMLSIGHPILGDRLYAPPEGLSKASRLQLHACYLSFTHPTTNQDVEFNSPCPF